MTKQNESGRSAEETARIVAAWAEVGRRNANIVNVKGFRGVLPKSKLGEALTYTINQWDPLARCFEDGEVELSNNPAENSMRPCALGRKNWLHVGSVKAGPTITAIAWVVESCRRLCLPVAEYLLDVLPGLFPRSHRPGRRRVSGPSFRH